MHDKFTSHSPREQSATCAYDADLAAMDATLGGLLESMEREDARHRAEGLKMLAGWRAATASHRNVSKTEAPETEAGKSTSHTGETGPTTAPKSGTRVKAKPSPEPASDKHPSAKPTKAITLDDVRFGVRRTRRARKAKAPWDAIKSGGRVFLFHETLRSLGPTLAYTVCVRPDVAEKAAKSPNAANYLSKRLAYHLGRAGLPSTYWFTIEISDGAGSKLERLHLHGAILAEEALAPAIRKALRKAAGEWEPRERWHQAHTSVDPDAGWATYSTKEAPAKEWVTKRYGTGTGVWSLPFAGKAHTATRDLLQLAKSRYEEGRKSSLTATQFANETDKINESVSTDLINTFVDNINQPT